MSAIRLQPKQAQALDLLESSRASWIGIGGGRGGAKSGGLQRLMLTRRTAVPGTVGAIVMRNYDQVKRYHIDPMLRDYPELAPYFHKTESKIVLPMDSGPPSEIHFTYAESLEDVVRRFRSANYYDVFVDQAEQFSESELREVKQCVRWAGAPDRACKLVLAFNMGGAGIDFLRRIFHTHEYGPNEAAEDFKFIHVFPWDNVEWCRTALTEDGLTDADYYDFSEAERMAYCATRADYGRNLNAQDEPLRKRDWFGSWEALEGAYFGRVFDRDSTVVTLEQVKQLAKPWIKRWISQDWGRGHFAPSYWHCRGELSVEEAEDVLGWKLERPLRYVLTYREYIAGGAASSDEGGEREIAEQDIAREIASRTQPQEARYLRSFFLSPDAFAKRSSANTIAQELGAVLTRAHLPAPSEADNDRIGGWGLMYNLLLETKRHGGTSEEVWLISANCPELIRTIPTLMRDPRNLDDVLKTDKGTAKLEQDVADAVRYGLKSMLMPNQKPLLKAAEDKVTEFAKARGKDVEDLDLNTVAQIHRRALADEQRKRQARRSARGRRWRPQNWRLPQL